MKKKSTILPGLTVATAILAILSIVVFTLKNQENISSNNREYLLDNTSQMAVLVDDSLLHGLTNIQALSDLAGELLTSPEIDVATLQRILNDSIFDFIEFADKEGKTTTPPAAYPRRATGSIIWMPCGEIPALS